MVKMRKLYRWFVYFSDMINKQLCTFLIAAKPNPATSNRYSAQLISHFIYFVIEFHYFIIYNTVIFYISGGTSWNISILCSPI